MSARQNALGMLQRSTSQREQQRAGAAYGPAVPQSLKAPALQRSASDRARDLAAARLEGTATPDASDERSASANSTMSSFVPDGAPPRLSALQRRHLEQQQQQTAPSSAGPSGLSHEYGEIDEPEYDSTGEQSPSFSIFAPSIINMPQPGSSDLSRNPSVERQAARSNLIRKLSKRDGPNTPRGAPSVTPSSFDQPEYETEVISDQAASPSTPVPYSISSSTRLDSSQHRYETSSAEPSPTSTAYTRPSSIATDAPSEFRPYRHTIERDRDSVFAQLMSEDQFEYASILNGRRPVQLEDDADDTEELLDDTPARSTQPLRKSNSSSSRQSTRSRSSSNASTTQDYSPSNKVKKKKKPSLDDIKPFPAPSASYQFPSPPPSARIMEESNGHREHNGSTSKAKDDQARRKESTSSRRDRKDTSPRSSIDRSKSTNLSPQASLRTSSRRDEQSMRNSHESGRQRSYKSSSGFESEEEMQYDGSDEENWGAPLQHRLAKLSAPEDSAVRSAILAKFSSIVQSTAPTYSPGSSKSELDAPPRKLLMHAPVLQVVNANTVKDRYLFLFNDILVIAKSIVEEDAASGLIVPPSLETKFLVKSIIELDKLKLTAQKDDEPNAEDPSQKKKHSLLQSFVDRFANDPKKAIGTLVSKGGLQNEPITIANLLFRTTDLNRSQLGSFLCRKEHKHVLKAYVDRFRLGGLRIEDAVRVFISSLRLPNDPTAAEYLLVIFGSVYVTVNPGCGIEQAMCGKLVMAMMELNDYLHSGMDEDHGTLGNLFGFPNPAITVDDFMLAFRSKDPKFQVPDATLTRVYSSIKRERIQQAADNSIAGMAPEIPVMMNPARLPSRLTYRIPSEEISITLPQTDSRFQIKLLGPDAKFEPSTLNFAKSRTQTFRMTGTALGHKTAVLLRTGSHANYYSGLPINKTFVVERAFMRYTFQLAFVNHLAVKRKYMFSMTEADLRNKWISCLRAGVENAILIANEPNTITRQHHVANAVALQVLRDALIAPDDPIAPGTTLNNNSYTAASRNGRYPSPANTKPSHVRSNSFSKTYAFGPGKAEVGLMGDTPKMGSSTSERRPSGPNIGSAIAGRRGSKDEADTTNTSYCKTGADIVMMVCQNSHLPAVLSMLNAHVSAAKHATGK